MTENVPPSQAPASAAATDQPGRPYYEHLRTVLRSTIEKKRKLDEQLAALEEQIYKTEGSYLEETSGAGNIVRGFDGWVKGVVIGGRGDDRRRGRIREEDRIFSRSSMSWMRLQEGPGTNSNTPSHAPTPTGSLPPPLSTRESNHATPSSATLKAPNKKKRPTERDDEEESKSSKRGKISYARD